MEDHEEYFLRMLDMCNSFIDAYCEHGLYIFIARFAMETHEALKKMFKVTEDVLKYLSTTKAEWVGEIVKPHDKERFLVKIDGHRYIVNCSSGVDQSKLVPGTRGVLLYGPPGTGKTMLARAIASNTNSTFLMVCSNELLRLGDSPLLVKEMFKYARDHQPCIIFMDEIDAIGRRRTIRETGTSLASKVIMATNRRDLLDSALIRPGRIDQKITIPLPNESSRMRILQIHASPITKQEEIDFEKIVKLSEGFNGADMSNTCTEAGMFAIRADRDYVVSNDFIKAGTKIDEAKKLESNAEYNV